MQIIINTTRDSVTYQVQHETSTTNDEISRVITHLEIIKLELLEELKYDFTIEKKENE